MIRVAFGVSIRVLETALWIGGRNYFSSLIKALLRFPEAMIEPVILGGKASHPQPFNACSQIPLVPPSRRLVFSWLDDLEDWAGRTIMDNGGHLSQHLKQHDIQLLSHGPYLGSRSPVPAMCWIADFQHLHYPEFFLKHDRDSRNRKYRKLAEKAQAVLLSSEHAKSEFCSLYPKQVGKAQVLQFVADIPLLEALPSYNSISATYKIQEPYFHVSNQIWSHKNHKIIVEALRILKNRGACPLVVSTGNTSDYRNPSFFATLTDSVHGFGLDDRIRFLGLIPFDDMAALMKYSVAVINPSLFEGWSTAVEEAKSMGKRVLLSDIQVHREQKPERGFYFPPHDAEALACALTKTMDTFDNKEEKSEMTRAASELPDRIRRFAIRYAEVVRQVIG